MVCTIVLIMNTNKVLVDASAVLAIILNEPEKDQIIHNTKGKVILSVGCLSWEIGNAFSAMLKQKKLSFSDVKNGLAIFSQIPWEMIKENLIKALDLCQKHNIHAYDSYYLEAASRNNLVLLSLDEHMNSIAKIENIKLLEV